jgi:hypothetical protein
MQIMRDEPITAPSGISSGTWIGLFLSLVEVVILLPKPGYR